MPYKDKYYLKNSPLGGWGAFFLLFLILLLSSCSNKKNTAQTRWWQAFTAKYNTYYNGTLAYIDASIEKENGNKDNYTEMLPLYTVGRPRKTLNGLTVKSITLSSGEHGC